MTNKHFTSKFQVQVKEAENMVRDILNHASSVQCLKGAGDEVTCLPVEAITDQERDEVKKFCGKLFLRFLWFALRYIIINCSCVFYLTQNSLIALE